MAQLAAIRAGTSLASTMEEQSWWDLVVAQSEWAQGIHLELLGNCRNDVWRNTVEN